MSLQSTSPSDDGEIFALVKMLSGKRIEQRRRRDGISQGQLAAAIGRSDRWIREMEAGIPTSTIEDHVRCAHWLGMSTIHIFIPLLCMEHGVPIPQELLTLDDLWPVEEQWLETLLKEQANAQRRHPVRSTRRRDDGLPKAR
jgi:transcriptional regulator with XRE-family HTH domain